MRENKKEEESFNATVLKVIFQNKDNGYCVLRLEIEGTHEEVTGVGYLGDIMENENIQCHGLWEENPKFGKQFKISQFRQINPSTEKGMISFLSSGMIEGIGPKYAKRIVDTFGNESIDIISNHPDRLYEVPGLGKKRIKTLLESWKKHFAVRDIMMFLQSYDISPTYAYRIYKTYGSDASKVVQENPYRLAHDIPGIGFLSADKIAQSLGFALNAPTRLEAGLIFCLTQHADSGHTFSPKAKLLKHALSLLQVKDEEVLQALETLIQQQSVIESTVEEPQQKSAPVNAIYLKGLYLAEVGVQEELERLLSKQSPLNIENAEERITHLQEDSQIEFSKEQKEAIMAGLMNKVLVITGGPGTGKTTIMKTLVSIYQKEKILFRLAAPTGRAAKRISESSGFDATTIHRLLEFHPKFNEFLRNEEYPLEVDAVIIDEASMMDILLIYHLLKALPDHCIFILIGDVDQLPSVGPGTVLRDFIHSGKIPTQVLNTIFRQAKGSQIVVNAHRVNQGEDLLLSKDKQEEKKEFFFIRKSTPYEISNTIIELVSERVPQYFKFNPLTDIQVLTPMHKTEAGVLYLNQELQKKLNPNKHYDIRKNLSLAVGDKVMQTANRHDLEIYNGDIGYVQAIQPEKKMVDISFDHKEQSLKFQELDNISLAYAVTIHKSQGSEYPCVIIPLTTAHYTLLQRNLLYTAITRGKEVVILVGSPKALNIAIKNQRTDNRFSALRQRLATIATLE